MGECFQSGTCTTLSSISAFGIGMYNTQCLTKNHSTVSDYADRDEIIAQEGDTCTTLGSARLKSISRSAIQCKLILKGWYICMYLFVFRAEQPW